MKPTPLLLMAGALLSAASPALAAETAADTAETRAYIRSHQPTISLLPKSGVLVTPGVMVSLDGSDFGFGSDEVRDITGETTLRYGLSRNTELVGKLQIARTEQRSDLLGLREARTSTTGTAEIGVRQLLSNYDDARPEIVASVTLGYAFSDLSGVEPYARAGLEAYQLLDPVLLSGEVGVSVGARTGATRFDLHGTATFAVNDRLSLSMGVSWVSGAADFGRPLETGVSLRGSVTLASPLGDSVLTPYVAIGATQAAPDAVLGVAWSRRW